MCATPRASDPDKNGNDPELQERCKALNDCHDIAVELVQVRKEVKATHALVLRIEWQLESERVKQREAHELLADKKRAYGRVTCG